MPEDIEPGPYADVMPDMSESEYNALKQSIKTTGFDETQPIVVDTDGNIVDGHHRYRACQEVGVEPEVVVDEDATPEDAYRRNLARRNLDGGTKRDVVKRYLDEYYDGDRTQENVASELGVAQSTVSEAWKEINPDDFTRDEKRQQARAYLDDNPDASNREVAREIEADVSHPTIGSWRDEWESNEDDAEDEEAAVDGDDTEVSGPQSVSGPTDAVSGPDEADKPLDTDDLPDGYDADDGEDLEEIADRGDDNVDVDVVDHGPGGEDEMRQEYCIEAMAMGAWGLTTITEGFGVPVSVAEALREACDDASGLLRIHDNLDSLDELPGVGEESAKDIKRVIPQLESEGVTKHYLPVSDDDTTEADTDDPTDDTDEDDRDIEDFEGFDPDEYELDADTREDVEELCRDVLGDDVDSQELEGRVDELEAVLEDMVRAFENQDVQTLERVAEGRAREVLDA